MRELVHCIVILALIITLFFTSRLRDQLTIENAAQKAALTELSDRYVALERACRESMRTTQVGWE